MLDWHRGGVHLALAGIALAALVGCATAPPPVNDVQQLEDLFVKTMPFGMVIANVAARDPNWPLQSFMDRLTAKDVACMRGELTPEKADEVLRRRARAYASAHPDRVADDVRVLGGVATFMHQAASEVLTGQAKAQPNGDEVKRFADFIGAPDHQALREALFLDGAAQSAAAGDGERFGRALGRHVLMPLTMAASAHCQIDLSKLK